jgi:hypothetical protein
MAWDRSLTRASAPDLVLEQPQVASYLARDRAVLLDRQS